MAPTTAKSCRSPDRISYVKPAASPTISTFVLSKVTPAVAITSAAVNVPNTSASLSDNVNALTSLPVVYVKNSIVEVEPALSSALDIASIDPIRSKLSSTSVSALKSNWAAIPETPAELVSSADKVRTGVTEPSRSSPAPTIKETAALSQKMKASLSVPNATSISSPTAIPVLFIVTTEVPATSKLKISPVGTSNIISLVCCVIVVSAASN